MGLDWVGLGQGLLDEVCTGNLLWFCRGVDGRFFQTASFHVFADLFSRIHLHRYCRISLARHRKGQTEEKLLSQRVGRLHRHISFDVDFVFQSADRPVIFTGSGSLSKRFNTSFHASKNLSFEPNIIPCSMRFLAKFFLSRHIFRFL